MHLNSRLLFEKYGLPNFKEGMKVLEIAPSSFPSPYETIAKSKNVTWETIDFVTSDFVDVSAVKNLTYELKHPYNFPLADNTYDIILSGQVLEHVEKIWTWIAELKRILKPGGKIITINPVSWPYHEAPIDCWRVYPRGINALAEELSMAVDLSKFESLEEPLLLERDSQLPLVPGHSFQYKYAPKILDKIIRWNKLVRKLPKVGPFVQVPIEVAYDTISILRKS